VDYLQRIGMEAIQQYEQQLTAEALRLLEARRGHRRFTDRATHSDAVGWSRSTSSMSTRTMSPKSWTRGVSPSVLGTIAVS
jgi:selenocysteine lyase/cysteine desulfurase